jgi:hypothetical protein
VGIAKLEALFDDVGRKLVGAELHEIFENSFDKPAPLRGVVASSSILQNVLRYVVAVLVSDEHGDNVEHLFKRWGYKLGGTVLEDALDDPASVRVRRELANLTPERANDEFDPGGRPYLLDALLNDVVAVLILNAPHHSRVELPEHRILHILGNQIGDKHL